MKYYSTNRISAEVDFREATIQGQAPDGGLYFPSSVPLTGKEISPELDSMSNQEIALRVISPYVGNSIPVDQLSKIVNETINFPIPLVSITRDIAALELFHGPTLAFKDIGARFMSRCLGYFVSDLSKKVTVLVATSGDTGGAVADGFYGVEGVEVVILYPSGKVSEFQEKQLTTHGYNIYALEVNGSFDDCQQLVKQAFTDKDITDKLFLTSANSINVARWLPQQFYYYFGYKQWKDKDRSPVVSVPSGNFGNICAGMLAARSGLPIDHFIAACNVNDIAVKYLESGKFNPKPAIATLSNAMDVGNPSNFVRLLELYNQDADAIRSMLSAYTITDEETLQIIAEIYEHFHYMTDPHGAVGYLGLSRYLSTNPGKKGFFLETAHPSKFPLAVEEAIGFQPEIPLALQGIMDKEKIATRIPADYSVFKSWLLK